MDIQNTFIRHLYLGFLGCLVEIVLNDMPQFMAFSRVGIFSYKIDTCFLLMFLY